MNDDATLRGLTEAEAAARRAAGQSNAYEPPSSRGYRAILRQNAYLGINGPLLIISAALVAYGLYVEAALTAAPVVANIGIGAVQETRAKRAIDRIAILTRPGASVVRDGAERPVDIAEVVLGDLVVAHRGDQNVVDGELVGDERVELDEAILTGESDAVGRSRGDDVRAGTSVLAGTARYVATRVGADTTANRLIAQARQAPDHQTPLQREVARTIWAVAAVVLAVGVIALIGAVDRTSRATIEAAAVLVTLVPQGLAIMLTVTYAAGALRISRLGALVQRQRAVESMSRVDTLCIDKTGTLTTQEITFDACVPLVADGDGHDIERLLGVMAASTTAANRTTSAIASAFPAEARPLADEVPFTSARRWSGLRLADDDRPLVMGAATSIVPVTVASGEGRREIEDLVEATASTGRRVLVVARGPAGTPLHDADGQPALPDGLEPLAILSLTEELRADARATLAELSRGEVTVRVISGDDPATVDAVARQLGMSGNGDDLPARSGPELAALDDDALAREIAPVTRFGRVDPGLKARLVSAFRAAGHYVAMIGDGVNDVLPLRHADLSVAMASGSAATRAAADLVLLGDRFAVLPRAVVEGRRILAAMQATLVLLLSRTFAVILIVLVATLLALPFPITPRQNAVLALLTVGAPLVLLVLWVPPTRTPARLLLHTLRTSIPAAVALAALAIAVYAWSLAEGADVDLARTRLTAIAVFGGLGLLPLIRPARRPPDDPPIDHAKPWLLAAASCVVYIVVVQLPFVRELYELVAQPIDELLALAALGLAWTAVVHGIRWIVSAQRPARGG